MTTSIIIEKNNRQIKILIIICALLCFGCIAGCVKTTTNGSPKVNKNKAVEANVTLGMTYLNKGNRDGAFRSFNKALEIDKKSAEANQGLALVHQLNGEHKLAQERFEKALKGRADFSKAGVYASYGRFLLEQDRCEEAIPLFESANKDLEYPQRSNSISMSGECYLKLNDIEKAKSALIYATSINPKQVGASIALAEIYFSERNYTESKKYLDMNQKYSRLSARALWLGIKIERIFKNKDKEGTLANSLKSRFPYSKEYLEYKNLIEQSM